VDAEVAGLAQMFSMMFLFSRFQNAGC
jgi:hypothetical protein